jgi:putative phage-type endonuclease
MLDFDKPRHTEREKWLLERRKGIGGSDVGAIIGISQYSTPLDIYLDKTGQTPLESEENAAMYWGNQLEEIVAKEFAKRTGRTVQRRNSPFVHPQYDFLRANIDRYIVGEKAVLECKTAGEYSKSDWGPAGSDEVPLYYLCQVMHYMTVTRYLKAYIAVLIGGRDFRIYSIAYDKKLADQLIQRCTNFWNNHVLKRTPPDPVNMHDINLLFKGDDDIIECADEATIENLSKYKKLKDDEKANKAEQEDLKFKITSLMKEATMLVDPEGTTLATFKAPKNKPTRTFSPKYKNIPTYKENE